MTVRNFKCRHCGHPVDFYRRYHSDEEGFWHWEVECRPRAIPLAVGDIKGTRWGVQYVETRGWHSRGLLPHEAKRVVREWAWHSTIPLRVIPDPSYEQEVAAARAEEDARRAYYVEIRWFGVTETHHECDPWEAVGLAARAASIGATWRAGKEI